MRLPLLAAALAAVATTVPAHAAVYPVCAVAVAPTMPTDTCTSGNTPQVTRTRRTFTVVVADGTVDATLRCVAYPYPETTQTRRVTGPATTQLSTIDRGKSCYATLTAVGEATASGVSYFVGDLIIEP